MITTGSFKDRLMDTLHVAVRHFNEDGDPNSAVVKAAEEADFNTEQTTRLVEVFNTARTLYHYKSASDRTSEFALADAGVVLSALFEKQDAPAVKTSGNADYSSYDNREQSYHAEDQQEKAAADFNAPRDSGLTLEALSGQAMMQIRSLRQTAKCAADESRQAAMQASVSLNKLAILFSRGHRESMHDQCARLFAGYGTDVEWTPVVTKLAEFIPAKDRAPAELVTKYAKVHVVDATDLGTHIGLLKEAREWMETECELLAGSALLEKEADDFEREWMSTIDPFAGTPAGESLAAFVRAGVKAAATEAVQKYKTRNLFGEEVDVTDTKSTGGTQAPGMADGLTGMIGNAVNKPLTSMMDTGVTRMMSAPVARDNSTLSEKLKNVQRQIMLQDLLVNDPVLAEEAPETVAEAFNAILQMAPEVASNKEVVRAVLRQTVHSVAVSPYDAEIWTKLEKNLRNIRGKGTPMSEDRA